MLLTTTATLEGGRIIRYHGIVTGETVMGANVFRDFFASIRDIVGGRSGSYETVLRDGRNTAFQEMMAQGQQLGANAIVGIDIDYATVGNSMLMITVTGTAVSVEMALGQPAAPAPGQGFGSQPWSGMGQR